MKLNLSFFKIHEMESLPPAQSSKLGEYYKIKIKQTVIRQHIQNSSVTPYFSESQRPERLLNRLSKLSVDESAPRLVVVRQPFGPDGTKGFAQPRVSRKPGVLNLSRDSTSSAGSQ